jgi:UDP-N-acetylmuramyl pentapeptide phosphotransferase/UDP-N-acetylglucosamine-1-phosphate transferase
MLLLFLTGATAFIISFLVLPAIIKIADAKRLFDVPDNRKIHKKPIASLGGVGMFAGFFITDLLFISTNQHPEFQYFFAAATIIFFLGLKDDILIITPVKKFLGQVFATAILIHLGGLRIDSMHGVFGLRELPEALSLGLSYITIILIINAYNLIDGIDGLAGMLGLLSMAIFGFYFFTAGQLPYAMLAFTMGGSLLAFLIFNHYPAKIFMGDSGSLMLGLFNAILALKFLNVADTPGAAYKIESVVPLVIAILSVPLIDTVRVFGIRIFQGRSPFSPDRNHIHHLLLRKGLKHKHVTLCCVLINLLLVSFTYFGRMLGSSIMLCGQGALVLSLLAMLIYYPKPFVRPALTVAASLSSTAEGTKVVSLLSEPVAAVRN